MGNTYRIGEVAEVLGVSWKTIIRRIESGELGARKRRGFWHISSDDLKKWVLARIVMRDAPKGYAAVENNGIKSGETTGHPEPLNWLVYQDGTTVYRPLKGSGQHASPQVAAVELQNKFRGLASRMAGKDPHLQDDLVQEMSAATLMCRGMNTMSFYCARAECRARNYLEYERRRGMKSLEDIKYDPAVPERDDETHIVKLEQVRKLLRMAEIPESMLQAEFDINLSRVG
jgi:excisionase family DNA binding protein